MSTNKRLRGRALQKRRAVMRTEQPYCVDCLALGHLVPWEELDHEVSLEHGGEDVIENITPRCKPHHADKPACTAFDPPPFQWWLALNG